MPLAAPVIVYDHLKPRYSFSKVCKILDCHPDTLHEWRITGIPLRDARRIRIASVPLGARRIEFECDEIERVYLELKASAAEEGDVLAFRNDVDRAGRKRRRIAA